MAAIRYKWGGTTWSGNVPNGNLRTKWGGGWFVPTYAYAKTGDVGTGSWVDSGYRGYPNPPQGLSVYAWSLSAVALQWGAPAAGGAPTVAYQLVQTDSAGNWLSQVEVGGSPWGNFGVGEDGYYQFYVRSKSAAGLYSGFVGPVRVKIGHSEQGYYATENRTRAWNSEQVGGYRNANDPFWVGDGGGNVVVLGMHWRNLRTGGMSSVVTPFGNRTVNAIFNGGDFGDLAGAWGTIYNGHSADWGGFNNQGNGNPWGIVARGSGWSTTGNGFYMLVCDALWLDGSETYQVTVYYVTRNYEGNSYW